MPKAYQTVRGAGSAELVIKKSRFIGRCFPASAESEAVQTLERLKKQEWQATHHCYALRIGINGACTRSSDDGEPSGTAGAPILNVLSQRDITDALCVVTRYFGGILLGAGGLVRTYSDAASAAIENAGIVFMRSCTRYEMTAPYPLLAAVQNASKRFSPRMDAEYAELVRLSVWIEDGQSDAFLTAVRDATDARVVPAAAERAFRPMEK